MTKKDILKLYPDFKFEELNKSENKEVIKLDTDINEILNDLEKKFDSKESIYFFIETIKNSGFIKLQILNGVSSYFGKSMSNRAKKRTSRTVHLFTKFLELYNYFKGNMIAIINNQSKEVIDNIKKEVIPNILQQTTFLTDDRVSHYTEEIINDIFGENA